MQARVRRGWRGSRSARVLVALVIAGAGLGASLPGARAATGLPTNVTLTPSIASPIPVGTRVTWTATASDSVPLVYQFGLSVTGPAGPYTVLRDFSPRNSFVTAPLIEGTVYISVTVKEGYAAKAGVSTQQPYTYNSRVVGGKPAINPTANPLVALYSAPPCTSGLEFVAFRPLSGTTWQGTNAQPCVAKLDHNFLVAGMLPSTTYQMVSIVVTGTVSKASSPLTFTTGSIPKTVVFPTISVPLPPGSGSDTAAGTLLHLLPSVVPSESGSTAANPIATDLQGRTTWYANETDITNTWALRIQQVPGPLGSIVYLAANDGQTSFSTNVLRSIDLAGDPLQETNVEAINAQLPISDSVVDLNHDALRLPNGDTAVIAYNLRAITSTTTIIEGAEVLVLDQNFQVRWFWNAFNFPHLLNLDKGPILGDSCGPGLGSSCSDWLHANALAYTPSDHNLVLSLRNQSWIIKIDYDDGAGNGHVMWRLGPNGDFKLTPLNPTDPYPWFSYQHDPNFVNDTTLEVFDNGDVRCNGVPSGCDSRGQVYTIDEADKVVTQTVNQDVGSYSGALGTAQRLSNGNYNFTSGVAYVPSPSAQDIEFQPNGTKEYEQQVGTPEYRAWRLSSLYAPINPACPTC